MGCGSWRGVEGLGDARRPPAREEGEPRGARDGADLPATRIGLPFLSFFHSAALRAVG